MVFKVAFGMLLAAVGCTDATTSSGVREPYSSSGTFSGHSASANPRDDGDCAMAVHPYKTAPRVLASVYDRKWFTIHKSDAECWGHLRYLNNNYSPQPPAADDNPLPLIPGINEVSAPVTQHNHAYHNDWEEDDKYYKSFVAKFEITLKQDALVSVDLSRIVCMTPTTQVPIETLGCNTADDLPVWGGTQIRFDAKTGVARWSFGQGGGGGRPVIYGNNPGLNHLGIPDMPDTTVSANRIFEPAIKLTTMDNPGSLWSATTSGRILLMDQAIKKSAVTSSPPNFGGLLNVPGCATPGDFDRWCPISAPTHIPGVEGTEAVGERQYYWFRIGAVATVWRKSM